MCMNNYSIRRAEESGLARRWQQKHWPRKKGTGSVKVEAVTLGEIAGLFALMVAGATFALLVLLVERTFYLLNKTEVNIK